MEGGIIIRLLGEYLKENRIKNNLTLQALSSLTDISISELSALERGKINKPSSVFLLRLSNALNIEYNEVLKLRWEKYPNLLIRKGIF